MHIIIYVHYTSITATWPVTSSVIWHQKVLAVTLQWIRGGNLLCPCETCNCTPGTAVRQHRGVAVIQSYFHQSTQTGWGKLAHLFLIVFLLLLFFFPDRAGTQPSHPACEQTRVKVTGRKEWKEINDRLYSWPVLFLFGTSEAPGA